MGMVGKELTFSEIFIHNFFFWTIPMVLGLNFAHVTELTIWQSFNFTTEYMKELLQKPAENALIILSLLGSLLGFLVIVAGVVVLNYSSGPLVLSLYLAWVIIVPTFIALMSIIFS